MTDNDIDNVRRRIEIDDEPMYSANRMTVNGSAIQPLRFGAIAGASANVDTNHNQRVIYAQHSVDSHSGWMSDSSQDGPSFVLMARLAPKTPRKT